jgi:hypothetical protein
VLLKAGAEACYQSWWYLTVACIALLVASPLLVWQYVKTHNTTPFCVGATQVLSSQFLDRYGYWAVVLLIQRAVLIALDTFMIEPLLRSIGLMSWCLLMLLTQTLVQPFVSPVVNRLQTYLLSCLTVLCILQLPQSAISQGAFQLSGDNSKVSAYLTSFRDTEHWLTLAPVPYFLWLMWHKRHETAAVFQRLGNALSDFPISFRLCAASAVHALCLRCGLCKNHIRRALCCTDAASADEVYLDDFASDGGIIGDAPSTGACDRTSLGESLLVGVGDSRGNHTSGRGSWLSTA